MLKKIFVWFIAVLLSLFVCWNIAFGFYVGYVLLVLLSGGLYFFQKTGSARKFWRAILAGLILYLLVLPFSLYQYNNRINSYINKIANGQDLNFAEKSSIYGLNLLIGIVAYPFLPEVSQETILLAFPDKDGIRYFESDFFLKSDKITQALATLPDKTPKWISWSHSEYGVGNEESRFALALNACLIEKIESDHFVTYTARVQIDYPMKSEVVLMDKPLQIKVEEGLFGYLQKVGWLHPYEAVWICRKPKIEKM
jgi:hypothetical protein